MNLNCAYVSTMCLSLNLTVTALPELRQWVMYNRIYQIRAITKHEISSMRNCTDFYFQLSHVEKKIKCLVLGMCSGFTSSRIQFKCHNFRNKGLIHVPDSDSEWRPHSHPWLWWWIKASLTSLTLMVNEGLIHIPDSDGEWRPHSHSWLWWWMLDFK